MRKSYLVTGLAVLALLASLPTAQAQKMESTPVDLSAFLNADGWYHDEADDPGVPTTDASGAGAVWGLDDGGLRVKISTLPKEVIPGKANVTEDGEVAFLLPTMAIGELDAYYPDGKTIPVPEGKYKYVYLAVMSGNGEWPGNSSNWGDETDVNTGAVTKARPENNAFTPVYDSGAGKAIPIGKVNDWFWSPPEWVTPESGNADEVIASYLTYEGDPDYVLHFVDGANQGNHDYGQYTYVNGEGDFIYAITIPAAGLSKATLYTEMWGNIKMSISNGDFADDASYKEIFNSVTSDKAYPTGGDGYEPNRMIRSHDVSEYVKSTVNGEIYLKFQDAAPDQVDAAGASSTFGPRVHQLGLFTGPVVKSKLGQRLWPGLVRTDGASPSGGLILIKKKYMLDDTKTLKSIAMPTNIPRSDPFLTVFAVTLANEGTAVDNFMLY